MEEVIGIVYALVVIFAFIVIMSKKPDVPPLAVARNQKVRLVLKDSYRKPILSFNIRVIHITGNYLLVGNHILIFSFVILLQISGSL